MSAGTFDDASSRTYRLARGMRLRRNDDGTSVLLIPEGLVSLNPTAAAALELVDGVRSTEEITQILRRRFDAQVDTISADVTSLLEALAVRGLLVR